MSHMAVGQVPLPDTVTAVQVVPARTTRTSLRLKSFGGPFYVGSDNTITGATGFISDVTPGYTEETLEVDTSDAVFALATAVGQSIFFLELYD